MRNSLLCVLNHTTIKNTPLQPLKQPSLSLNDQKMSSCTVDPPPYPQRGKAVSVKPSSNTGTDAIYGMYGVVIATPKFS